MHRVAVFTGLSVRHVVEAVGRINKVTLCHFLYTCKVVIYCVYNCACLFVFNCAYGNSTLQAAMMCCITTAVQLRRRITMTRFVASFDSGLCRLYFFRWGRETTKNKLACV